MAHNKSSPGKCKWFGGKQKRSRIRLFVKGSWEAKTTETTEIALTVNSFSLLFLALFTGFAGDERNKFAHTLLHCFLGVFGYLGVGW